MKTAAAALLIVTGAALDLAAKAWARAALEPYGPPNDFLPFVSLRLTFNEGVSFSMFAADGTAARLILLAVTALVTLAVGVYAFLTRAITGPGGAPRRAAPRNAP